MFKESPLHYIKNEHPINQKDICVKEIAFLGYLNLRGDINDKNFTDKIEDILGLKIPTNPNHFSYNSKYEIFCISPDEWLITTPEDEEINLETKIRQKLGEELFFAITNVSGGFTKINLNGSKSRNLLKKGTSLDVNPNNFKAGNCASTMFSKTQLLISKTQEQDEFNLIVRRSFAQYLWLYLVKNNINI